MSDHESYSSIKNESRKNIVHPAIAKLISKSGGIRLLDYGCGDASLLQFLQPGNEISLFDINITIASGAVKNFPHHKITLYQTPEEIPNNYFDYVICSLVLMTIPGQAEIKTLLRKIHSSLKQNGSALIAITHPCFREQVFSSFQTEFSQSKHFDYFMEGEAFTVIIKDEEAKSSVTFNDYHYSLGTVFNLLINSGLTITKILELPDKPGANGQYNKTSSPYLIFESIKHGDKPKC